MEKKFWIHSKQDPVGVAVETIAAGENAFSHFEFKRLMEMDALTYHQPDVAKVGEVTVALALLRPAGRHNAKITPTTGRTTAG
ncbi:MAG: hypothetical protein JRN44_01955 [Nitrososphaerota archaeon]|nr:hypothetical protein [Nitrososphaerota archaeon]MDG6947269.1 hypothetical protein [Nitrososphaerota archaeon]MDG6955298.1 hypothetical protein [Nitrososphaerota archaeon]